MKSVEYNTNRTLHAQIYDMCRWDFENVKDASGARRENGEMYWFTLAKRVRDKNAREPYELIKPIIRKDSQDVLYPFWILCDGDDKKIYVRCEIWRSTGDGGRLMEKIGEIR